MTQKFEVNLALVSESFKAANANFDSDNLSALYFGLEAKKVISNVVFTPRNAEDIIEALQDIRPIISSMTFLGVDDPLGTDLKKFSNFKLDPKMLKSMSAQKLATRLTAVKSVETMSTPPDGVNLKVAFMFNNSPESKDVILTALKSTPLSINDLNIENSMYLPTFNVLLDSEANEMAALSVTDQEISRFRVVFIVRVPWDIIDDDLHSLIIIETEKVLNQLLNVDTAGSDGKCLTFALPGYPSFVNIAAVSNDLLEKKLANFSKTLNLCNPKLLAPSRALQLNEGTTPLINPHEFVKVTPIGQTAMVSGVYGYHHYMQGTDDSGWGCAYRSLQTIWSWLINQGFTDKPVPDHRAIQQCLVDIGDKEAKFVGSHQWIGSTELSFCLETLLGISSRILSTNSGSEIASHARQLLYHFENGGGPVMIGGGQLAHTILGVDYNTRSGDCRYLILDPHFTGSDTMIGVVEGGWCGWKNGDFWSKKDYYNLLLPLTY